MRVSKIWPALRLANNRKHKVIGRTIKLIASTKLKKGIKYQGELDGSSIAITLCLMITRIILISQNVKASLRLNPNVVVKGYL